MFSVLNLFAVLKNISDEHKTAFQYVPSGQKFIDFPSNFSMTFSCIGMSGVTHIWLHFKSYDDFSDKLR